MTKTAMCYTLNARRVAKIAKIQRNYIKTYDYIQPGNDSHCDNFNIFITYNYNQYGLFIIIIIIYFFNQLILSLLLLLYIYIYFFFYN